MKELLSKEKENSFYHYLDDGVSFFSSEASALRTIYFPLCGLDAEGIKSSISPYLSGDIKIDKTRFLTRPASCEDLRHQARNFFIYIEGEGVVSLADGGQGKVEAGLLWHKVLRKYPNIGLEIEVLNFVPVSGENLEIMRVKVKNVLSREIEFVPTFSVPIFARALANKHDHEHVTSLLNRVKQIEGGVVVSPTMIFDERGHKPCDNVYYVLGVEDDGQKPQGSFPTLESFCGNKTTLNNPQAVFENLSPQRLADEDLHGKEAVGALRFHKKKLAPNQTCEYLIVIGVDKNSVDPQEIFSQFNTPSKIEVRLEENKRFWFQKTKSISFVTGDRDVNAWLQWVTLQPVLRRIYGCSFLPDHDYGKGGKGWRDIWQDLLSLILIEPETVREVLINNFAGVRVDGSNATIIGARQGEFLADRNAITRVWMDHGVWPFATLLLYINQTGDYDVLFEENTYFRDVQFSRSFQKDPKWTPQYGEKLKDVDGNIYQGTILEHILVQHLVAFFNVGEHNIARLEDADWNDGLDMAHERGESVAFMSFYGGNLIALADLLEFLSKEKDIETISLNKELIVLLDSLNDKVAEVNSGKNSIDYNNWKEKKRLLFEVYFSSIQPEISGKKSSLNIKSVVEDLRKKGRWIFDHIRKNEKISCLSNGQTDTWINGYYDNKGRRVEGEDAGRVRMTLVGQVFPIMSGLTNEKETKEIVRAVRTYLKDPKLGGFRLNTDFGVPHYLDLGRAFGFAYGTKENGAFFSHMIVMYAYALYSRGFVHEGREVLHSIYKMSTDTKRSQIYPGVPEYFDSKGRGRYHYLTGAASWFVLTQLTQVFGVRGEFGDLIIDPKLCKEEFDSDSFKAKVSCSFAGKRIMVCYENTKGLDYGDYKIKEIFVNEKSVEYKQLRNSTAKISREVLDANQEIVIHVILV